MNYWLMKSEPDVYGIDDLATAKQQTCHWEGVRNYQARNFMRDQMQVGDLAFFYHSNAKPPGIAGIVKVVTAGYPDHTAFDPLAKYFDPKSDPDNPRWYMVDVQLQRKFKTLLSLDQLRQNPKLAGMKLLSKGNRLSVMPVEKKFWDQILAMCAGE